jgi:hypothetical protein
MTKKAAFQGNISIFDQYHNEVAFSTGEIV